MSPRKCTNCGGKLDPVGHTRRNCPALGLEELPVVVEIHEIEEPSTSSSVPSPPSSSISSRKRSPKKIKFDASQTPGSTHIALPGTSDESFQILAEFNGRMASMEEKLDQLLKNMSSFSSIESNSVQTRQEFETIHQRLQKMDQKMEILETIEKKVSLIPHRVQVRSIGIQCELNPESDNDGEHDDQEVDVSSLLPFNSIAALHQFFKKKRCRAAMDRYLLTYIHRRQRGKDHGVARQVVWTICSPELLRKSVFGSFKNTSQSKQKRSPIPKSFRDYLLSFADICFTEGCEEDVSEQKRAYQSSLQKAFYLKGSKLEEKVDNDDDDDGDDDTDDDEDEDIVVARKQSLRSYNKK